ncbi:MAG: hypothetical protein QME94_04000 [Anaerolineae bacterium]|nr:hypothetical protein [Anaerolineae bacterium]
MFKKLGIGLDAQGKYERAFAKGVLLGDLAGAVRLFDEAAREFAKRGHGEGERRALANARLYEYLSTRKPTVLPALIDLLRPLDTIECIGSATETLSAPGLVLELEARQAEAEIRAMEGKASPEAMVALHERARDRFAALGAGPLVTYAYVPADGPTQTAEARAHLHAGHASWYRAQMHLQSDPAAAAEEMGRAVASYRLAGDEAREQHAAGWLADLRLSRTCWICGREMQGRGVHFVYLPSGVSPYHQTVLERSKQDPSVLQLEGSQVAVCVVCRDLLVNQARTMAAQVVNEALAPLARRLDEIADTVQRLSASAHTH